ncbi:MAG: hypothetical protein JWM40_1258 [Frankiales bacterium]|nr:hypothetical protein [Frankiales bacterium]
MRWRRWLAGALLIAATSFGVGGFIESLHDAGPTPREVCGNSLHWYLGRGAPTGGEQSLEQREAGADACRTRADVYVHRGMRLAAVGLLLGAASYVVGRRALASGSVSWSRGGVSATSTDGSGGETSGDPGEDVGGSRGGE